MLAVTLSQKRRLVAGVNYSKVLNSQIVPNGAGDLSVAVMLLKLFTLFDPELDIVFASKGSKNKSSHEQDCKSFLYCKMAKVVIHWLEYYAWVQPLLGCVPTE